MYLLTSLHPHCEGDYYIGYTVNPLRRLRQHNGELVHGASRTKRRGRPWTIVCCVSGFPEDRAALKFEWCWQHPLESVRLKQRVAPLAGLHRLPYAVGVLHLLTKTEPFSRLDLTLHVFESDRFAAGAAMAQAHASVGRRYPVCRATATDHYSQDVPASDYLLPDLTPSALFHIEDTTREAFEERYLRTDQDTGDTSVSCHFDLTVLSQTILEDTVWSASSGDDEGSPLVNRSVSPAAVRPDENVITKQPRRPPLKFRGMTEADLTRLYQEEKTCLDRGCLPCTMCALPLASPYILRCPRSPFCPLTTHIVCLAMWMNHNAESTDFGESSCHSVRMVPRDPCPCPLCGETLRWGALTKVLKQRATLEKRIEAHQRRLRVEARLQQRLQEAAAGGSKRRNGFSSPAPPRRGRQNGGANLVCPTTATQERGDGPATRTAYPSSVGLSVTDVDPEEWLRF